MPKITVVANGVYPAALDSGRHLHPGEVDDVEASKRHGQLIADHLLAVVKAKPAAPVSQKVPPAGRDQKEE